MHDLYVTMTEDKMWRFLGRHWVWVQLQQLWAASRYCSWFWLFPAMLGTVFCVTICFLIVVVFSEFWDKKRNSFVYIVRYSSRKVAKIHNFRQVICWLEVYKFAKKHAGCRKKLRYLRYSSTQKIHCKFIQTIFFGNFTSLWLKRKQIRVAKLKRCPRHSQGKTVTIHRTYWFCYTVGRKILKFNLLSIFEYFLCNFS